MQVPGIMSLSTQTKMFPKKKKTDSPPSELLRQSQRKKKQMHRIRQKLIIIIISILPASGFKTKDHHHDVEIKKTLL